MSKSNIPSKHGRSINLSQSSTDSSSSSSISQRSNSLTAKSINSNRYRSTTAKASNITVPDLLVAMESELTCSQCNSIFLSPHTLPCQHHFCYRCIEPYLERFTSCPVCQNPFWVKDLHENSTINNLIEVVESVKEQYKKLKTGNNSYIDTADNNNNNNNHSQSIHSDTEEDSNNINNSIQSRKRKSTSISQPSTPQPASKSVSLLVRKCPSSANSHGSGSGSGSGRSLRSNSSTVSHNKSNQFNHSSIIDDFDPFSLPPLEHETPQKPVTRSESARNSPTAVETVIPIKSEPELLIKSLSTSIVNNNIVDLSVDTDSDIILIQKSIPTVLIQSINPSQSQSQSSIQPTRTVQTTLSFGSKQKKPIPIESTARSSIVGADLTNIQTTVTQSIPSPSKRITSKAPIMAVATAPAPVRTQSAASPSAVVQSKPKFISDLIEYTSIPNLPPLLPLTFTEAHSIVPNNSIVLTGSNLKPVQLALLTRIAAQIGVEYCREYSNRVTHIITNIFQQSNTVTNNNSNSIIESRLTRRTIKYMRGLVGGKWIISFEWIINSAKCTYPVAESGFEIGGDNITGSSNVPALRRNTSNSNTASLFAGYSFALYGKYREIDPSPIELTELIQQCGGIVVQLPDGELYCTRSIDSNSNNSTAAVRPSQSQSRRSNPHYILLVQPEFNQTISSDKFDLISNASGLSIVSLAWVLDSICNWRLAEINKFKFNSKPKTVTTATATAASASNSAATTATTTNNKSIKSTIVSSSNSTTNSKPRSKSSTSTKSN